MPSMQCQQVGCRGRRAPLRLVLPFLLLSLALGPGQAAMHIPIKYQIGEVKQPPLITIQPDLVVAFTADDISMACEATGNPTPTFRWVKNGQEFDPSSDPKLTILPGTGTFVASGHGPINQYQGNYSCYASNSLGTAVSNEVQLLTESAPTRVKEKKVKKKVEEGEGTALICNPSNSSMPPVIHWMDKNLRHIVQSQRVTKGLDGNLYFANVVADDSRSDYTCHAQYISARTILPKEPITLTVAPSNSVVRNRRPQLMRPTGSHSSYLALVGSSLELECIPQGLPTPTVEWARKDGSLSESHHFIVNFGRVLRFSSVVETDDGEYQCTARNSQGTAKHIYTVTVEAAPHWIKQPESQLYAPGETVWLDCKTEGIPTPTVTWSLNGDPISSVDPDSRRTVQGGSLKLVDVGFGDTAVYQCSASNKHGTILHNAYVYVLELAPQILTDSGQTYTVTEGQTAMLDCQSFGSPKPKVTWESESTGLQTHNHRASQLANGSLQISATSREDSGFYTCSVLSANLSMSAQLEVLNKTVIVTPPNSLYVQRGQMAKMSCLAEVDPRLPQPVIQWRKNGWKIHESMSNDKYLMDGYSLTVSNVQSEDEGVYKCEVITKLDMAEASGSISITDKPDPPTLLKLSDLEDRSLILSWIPGDEHNSPVLEFVVEVEEQKFSMGEWKEAARISGDMVRAKLTLQPFGSYRFRVTAINDVGKSKASLPSDLHETPPAAPDTNPEDVRSELNTPDTLMIMWEEMDRQSTGGPGFRYKVMWREVIGQGPDWHQNYTTSPPFVVANVDTFTAFEIRVQAVNDLGEAPEPDPEIGYSGEDTPLEPPMDVGVELINSTVVKVKWAPVNRNSVRGQLLGYKVRLRLVGPVGGHRKGVRKEREVEREWESRVVLKTGSSEEKKLLTGLRPYSHYTVSVAVFNNKGEGPFSEPLAFHTLEGVPSPPTSLRLDSPSETELTLHWTPPAQHNGMLIGYLLQYQQIVDTEDSPMQVETIDDHTVSHVTLRQLEPNARYRFILRGRTTSGDGEAIIREGATLLDGVPPSNISMAVGPTSVNLSWVSEASHRNINFRIYYLNKKGGGEWQSSEKLNSSQSFYQLQGLQPGSHYHLHFMHSNTTFWETEIQTEGKEMFKMQEGFATQSWFIGLISAILALLLVLLILCLIKRTKGGKYSVKDKEEGQVDSEARPMKDETFGEYRSLESDNEEKGTACQPSLCAESKTGSEGNLVELGGSEVTQLSKDDSFIGQVGKLDVVGDPGDQEGLGATSPVDTITEPPANSGTSNSITGILD